MGIVDHAKRHLPSSLENLPTVVAERAFNLGAGGRFPSLEGPVFDRNGNFYCCRTAMNNTLVKRIAPDGTVSDFCHFDKGMVIGLAFHKDGRCFATDMARGTLRQIDPDGRVLNEVSLRDGSAGQIRCDCMVFDDDGSLLITDLRGTEVEPTGSIWKLTPDDGYTRPKLFFGGLASPNGICLARPPKGAWWDSDALWVAESAANAVTRISLDDAHMPVVKQYSPMRAYRNEGKPNVDTCCMDAEGNIYVAVMFGGRVVVLNQEGLPLYNVIVPGFEEWRLHNTPNLVIHPDRPECYLLASDADEAVVLKFPALAKSQKLYSLT